MTREEAIEILWRYDVNFEPHPPEEVMHAIDMAIEALEGKDTNVPTKDCISRQAAIDAMGEEPPVWYDGEDEIAERNQWRRDKAAIESLPSAEPKTGEWVLKEHLWECDQCGCRINRANPLKGNVWNYNFCPNCGADMRGEEE